MLECYTTDSKTKVIPITVLEENDFDNYLEEQPPHIQNNLRSKNFSAKPGRMSLLPDETGAFSEVVLGKPENIWDIATLVTRLPAACYALKNLRDQDLRHAQLAWGMESYQFSRYKKADPNDKKLFLAKDHADEISNLVEAIYSVRDLINTPTEDMGPAQMAQFTEKLAKEFDADFTQIIGEQLLQENFPAIFTVGRASTCAARLLELRWGDEKSPLVTLVGKGVCFDSGGLDIKPSRGMRIMKKDMGGAAHVLGLARLIMQAKLPVRLRVLIPAVENAVSGNAYRPGDVITMRNGKTVEVGNTDAEGRLVLADALTAACEENPELLIDFATLTGAARIAVGTDIAAMLTNDDNIAEELTTLSHKHDDLIWRLPLYKPYARMIKSYLADLCNSSDTAYGGAITAGLFLENFVKDEIPWVHFDVMAWNLSPRPAFPEGGEALGLRSVFAYLCERFQS